MTVSFTRKIKAGFSTGVPISVAMPAATGYANIEIRGIIDVNTACTVNPQIAFSDAPNTSCSIQPQAAMLISPIGTSSAVTSIGNWV